MRRGSCWPDADQELLLRAAILDGDGAVEAWHAWRARVDPASADVYSQRLLSLVFRRLAGAGLEEGDKVTLKEMYRRSWLRNQTLFAKAGAAIAELQGSGVDLLVLKGGASAVLDYRDVGVRPMGDVDILVRPGVAERAAETLDSLGWRTNLRLLAKLSDVRHAYDFHDPSGRGVDLHWYALARRQSDDDLWAGAVELRLGPATTLAPDAAGRLMHTCVHGAEAGDPAPVYWIADAAAVVATGNVVWSDLVERAERRQIALLLGRTLAYLRERMEVAVPGDVIDQLAAARHSRFERAAYRAAMRPRTVPNVVGQEWFRYRRMTATRSARGFLRYLQLSLGYERRRDLVRHVVNRLRQGPAR